MSSGLIHRVLIAFISRDLRKSTQSDCVTNWKGERASTPLVPGEDVMAILACAIDLLALHGTETDLEKDARTSKPDLEQ